MPEDRSYFHCLAKELDSLVEENKTNPVVLRDLLTEISLRKKSADKLRQTADRINSYLSKLRANESSAQELAVASETKAQLEITSTLPSNVSFELTDQETLSIRLERSRQRETANDGAESAYSRRLSTHGRRSWADRLLSVWPMVLEVSGDSLVVRANGSESENVFAKQETKWSLSKGFFFDRLRLCQREKGVLEARIRRHHVDEVRSLLYEWEFSEEIEEATAELEALLLSEQYLNYKKVCEWRHAHEALLESAPDFPSVSPVLSEFRALAGEFESKVVEKNRCFVEAEIVRWRGYFASVEKKPLTLQQMRAIVSDEDSCLAIAGAGTGKTSTVVGKIGYLIQRRVCSADEILALTYGVDAAKELRERVQDRLGLEVEVRTFHSLGKYVLETQCGVKLNIAGIASDSRSFDALLAGFVREETKEGVGKKLLHSFVSKHRYPAKYLEDFDSQGKYFDYLRKTEPRTLKGELVKSFEELLIADWLCLNGVRYEYERPYEVTTSSLRRRQYRPDFYLLDYGIYLEHFGINRSGQTAPGIDAKSYLESIEWKRALHRQQGTVLVETFSWERMEGIILDQLSDKLRAAGVELSPFDADTIHELIKTAKIDTKIISLIKDFLRAYKENQYSKEEILSAIEKSPSSDRDRFKCFFELFCLVFDRYSTYLDERQELDFADLISRATLALESGDTALPFSRVIVDEYQDISRGRFRFLKAILGCSEKSRLFAVGDDWQSIYGFTGSDVSKTTLFESFFEGAIRIPLDQTFRFNDKIHEISSSFVVKNPSQIKKDIVAAKSKIKDPVCFVDGSSCEDRRPIQVSLDEVMRRKPPSQKWSVFILGRYSFCEPKDLDEIRKQYVDLSVEFKTVHSSKGLEADAIVLVDLVSGRYGFPSKVESDPIQALVVPSSEDFEDGEERRLLYVAMTRARHCLVVVGDERKPSPFWTELLRIAGKGSGLSGSFGCPVCREGSLFKTNPNKTQGYAWECSFSPYCEAVAKTCEYCGTSPLFEKNCLSKSCKGSVS